MRTLFLVLSVSILFVGGCAHQSAEYAVDGASEDGYYLDGYYGNGGYVAGYYPYDGFDDCYGFDAYGSRYYSRLMGPCVHGGHGNYGYRRYMSASLSPVGQERGKVAAPKHSGTPRVVTRGSKGAKSQASHSSSGHFSHSSGGTPLTARTRMARR